MKKTLFFFALLILSSIAVKSQQFYISVGKINSAFDYRNSMGVEPPNMQSAYYNSMAIGFRTKFFTRSLFMNLGATYNSYGAITSDDAFYDFFEWDLTYLGAVLGFDLNIVKFNSLTVLLKASTAAEFLVHGSETHNSQVINLVGEDDFDAPVFFYRGGIGFQYDISDRMAVFADYMYGKSIFFKKNPETLKIETHNVKLGFMISLFKKPASLSKITQLEDEIKKISQRMKVVENKTEEIENEENEIQDLKEDVVEIAEDKNPLKEDIEKSTI